MIENSKALCFLPLLNFSGTFNSKDLGHGASIRKISRFELERIQNSSGRKEWPFNRFDMPRVRYTLEKEIDPTNKAFARAVEQFVNLVLSMRLFKPGLVGYKAAILFAEAEARIVHHFGIDPRVPIPKIRGYEKYPVVAFSLQDKDFKEYSLFKEKVLRFGGEDKNWPLPIRYFSRMYENKPIEDIFLDCMIGLEALVFKGEKEVREKAVPLALSVSMLVGKNSQEREKIKLDIKRAYKIRNNIVHGSRPRTVTKRGKSRFMSRIEIGILCWKIEDYLRRSIRVLLILE